MIASLQNDNVKHSYNVIQLLVAGCRLCYSYSDDGPRAFTSRLPLSWGQANSFPALESLGLFGLNMIGSLPAEWGCSRCFPKLQVPPPLSPAPLLPI